MTSGPIHSYMAAKKDARASLREYDCGHICINNDNKGTNRPEAIPGGKAALETLLYTIRETAPKIL